MKFIVTKENGRFELKVIDFDGHCRVSHSFNTRDEICAFMNGWNAAKEIANSAVQSLPSGFWPVL